ncbi:MAG: choice-of-anchor X domain-containing protein [bacterium]
MIKQERKFNIIYLIIIALIMAGSAGAENKASSGKVMTKGEAIKLLSTTDFMKKKIGELVSWTIGYDISKVTRVSLIPTINYIKVLPRKVPPDGRTIVEIIASVDDPGGLGNISGVRADLSSIGRLPNTMLVDNGLFGDTKAADGIYTLQTNVSPRIKLGSKQVPVAVANKKGWLAMAKTSLDIKKNPVIINPSLKPDQARADGRSVVTVSAQIDNPGRLQDLRQVSANLTGLGYQEPLLLNDDGQRGDVVAGDQIYSAQFKVPSELVAGEYRLELVATNLAGGRAVEELVLKVYK